MPNLIKSNKLTKYQKFKSNFQNIQIYLYNFCLRECCYITWRQFIKVVLTYWHYMPNLVDCEKYLRNDVLKNCKNGMSNSLLKATDYEISEYLEYMN